MIWTSQVLHLVQHISWMRRCCCTRGCGRLSMCDTGVDVDGVDDDVL